jgi:TnpA family transposase
MKSKHSYIFTTLKAGSLLVFVLMLSLFSFSGDSPGASSLDDVIRLNPDCKVKRLSNGSVIISAKNMEGVEEKHEFTDFTADLLMAVYRKQKTEFILNSFSKKYYLSRDECRREIKHALNVLAEWNIVERDDRIANR